MNDVDNTDANTALTETGTDEVALTRDERKYLVLVDKIVDICKGAEAANLKRYHKIGELILPVIPEKDESGKRSNCAYGESLIPRLAVDLVERGVLTDIQDPKRMLYWSIKLVDRFTWDQLEGLAERGFSVTHAKQLLDVSDEIFEAITPEMIVDGRVISTRDLPELIESKSRELVGEQAAAAITEEPVVPDGATEPSINPVTSLKAVEKALIRANAEIPNTFIAIRETREIGLDDDDHAQYIRRLKAMNETLEALNGPLSELRKEVKQELDAIGKAAG